MTTPMQRPRFWLLVTVTVLLLIAVMAVQRGSAAEPGASASAAKTVAIKNSAYQPKTLTVKRGSRVTFANSDSVPHTATKGGSFDTKRIAPGKSKAVQFNQRGTFAYHCKIHSFMRGKVIVE
jgi:plastocyanin